jgi:hypothetical protein
MSQSQGDPSKRSHIRLSDNRHAVEFRDKFPIIMAQFPGWEEINPLLEKGIRSVGDKQKHSTNVKADMTDTRMWESNQPAHEQFQVICKYAVELGLANSPPPLVEHLRLAIADCWGVVYRKDDFTLEHDHWPALWSFGYYINVSPDCAPIVFPGANHAVQPKNGMMCMFPGWVSHYVPKHQSSDDRVMLAGNIVHLFGGPARSS